MKKTKGKNKPAPQPTHSAVQGQVIMTRWRYNEYADEPYDIIHNGQDYGYANAKVRPAVVLGESPKGVVLAPMGTIYKKNGQVKMNAQLAMDKDMAYIPKTFAQEYAQIHHTGGTFINAADIQTIPRNELTFSEKQDEIYPESLIREVSQMAGISMPYSNGTIHSVDVRQNPRIHPDDLESQVKTAAKAMKKARTKKESETARNDYHQASQDFKRFYSTRELPQERAAHVAAREHNMTKSEYEEFKLTSGFGELSDLSQDNGLER